MLAQCGYVEQDGRFLVNQVNCSFYGMGHPSAVVENRGAGAIWRLFYYNHSGSWAEHGVYVATSTDGIHFGLGKQTALTNPVEVRRMVPPARAAIDSGESVALPAFVATMTLRSNATGPWHGKPIAYFATSDDGIRWRHWPIERGGSASAALDTLAIGLANTSDCGCPGQGSFIANGSGVIELAADLGMQMFVGNGQRGSRDGGKQLGCFAAEEDVSRGSTWSTYLMNGAFIAPPRGTAMPELHGRRRLVPREKKTEEEDVQATHNDTEVEQQHQFGEHPDPDEDDKRRCVVMT